VDPNFYIVELIEIVFKMRVGHTMGTLTMMTEWVTYSPY
jgi:hypothetical protein